MSAPSCSFCWKREEEVRALVRGPGAAICNECLDLCNDIIVEDEEQERLRRESQAEMKILGVREEEPPGADPPLVCAFCGKGYQRDVIAGPGPVYICKPCVRASTDVLPGAR